MFQLHRGWQEVWRLVALWGEKWKSARCFDLKKPYSYVLLRRVSWYHAHWTQSYGYRHRGKWMTRRLQHCFQPQARVSLGGGSDVSSLDLGHRPVDLETKRFSFIIHSSEVPAIYSEIRVILWLFLFNCVDQWTPVVLQWMYFHSDEVELPSLGQWDVLDTLVMLDTLDCVACEMMLCCLWCNNYVTFVTVCSWSRRRS